MVVISGPLATNGSNLVLLKMYGTRKPKALPIIIVKTNAILIAKDVNKGLVALVETANRYTIKNEKIPNINEVMTPDIISFQPFLIKTFSLSSIVIKLTANV